MTWSGHWRRARPAVTLLVGLFCFFQAVFLFGVVVAEFVPDQRVLDALVTATRREQLSVANYPTSGYGNRLDASTDCLAITMGLSDSEDSRFRTALTNPTLGRCSDAIPALELRSETGSYNSDRVYFRYWSGYTVITRPLLAYAGLSGLRAVAAVLLWGSTAALFLSVRQGLGALSAMVFLGPLLLTSDYFDLPNQTPHFLSMSVALLGGAMVRASWLRWRSHLKVCAVALVAGSLFSFVDLLTNPPLAWTATVGMAMLAAYETGRSQGRVALLGLQTLTVWMLGYAGSWIVKWFAVASILGVDRVRSEITEQVENRLAGKSDFVNTGFGESIGDNLDRWLTQPLISRSGLLIVAFALVVAMVLMTRRGGFVQLGWFALLATPALILPIWYELLKNHSQIHDFFTYRSIPFVVGYLLLVAVITSKPPRSRLAVSSPSL